MFCVIFICLIVICFRMHVLFLLLVDHVSQLKCEILYYVVWPSLNFNLKVFLQKISVRGNPKYVFKKQTDHDSPQYLMNMYIRIC